MDCTNSVKVTKGGAIIGQPIDKIVVSVYSVSPAIDIQGVINNTDKQIKVSIPHHDGLGSYDAFEGDWIQNNSGTGENDSNKFRLKFEAGTFVTGPDGGTIDAEIIVDGDESFYAKKLPVEGKALIATLDIGINGNSSGVVTLTDIGGIPDRNFDDAGHKFIYLPVTAEDGHVWLNNNLGADYADITRPDFDPTNQATHFKDSLAFGSGFQWGRYSDGHEVVEWISDRSFTRPLSGGETPVTSNTDTPKNSRYINGPRDWRAPHNNNLWQGEAGINNPCPNGFRLPTKAEYIEYSHASGVQNSTQLLNSVLKIPQSGIWGYDMQLFGWGPTARLWTSTVAGEKAYAWQLDNTTYDTKWAQTYRGQSAQVRCIQDY